MLKYKLNTKNAKCNLLQLDNIESIVKSGVSLYVTYNNESGYSINNSDTIAFSRVEEEDINFYEERLATIIEEESGKTLFSVDEFKNVQLNVNGITIESKVIKPLESLSKNYLCFYLKDKHFLYKNRTESPKEFIMKDYNPYIADNSIRRCTGDTILFENTFIYSATEVNEDYGRYSAFGNMLNKSDGTIIIIPNKDLIEYFTTEKRGNNWEYDEENNILYLYECITPSLSNGKDNRNLLMWRISRNELAEKIQENLSYLLFYTKDERFIKESGKTSENALFCEIQPNTKINKKEYSINILNLIQEDFSTNLIQEELLTENYVEETKEKKKNKIIDYEKQIFEPVFFNNDTEMTISGNVQKIEFTLNFRDRDEDYEEWKTNDKLKWNNYTINGSKLSGKTNYFKYSDLLGYLGFTDDDVYYRKKKLSKSFLRLSFYDTKNRANQKLLFTSTIFVNDADLFSNYMKKIKNNVASGESGYVFVDTGEDRLDATFKCKGKFFNEISNNYNNNASSEGFYLYLFPTILDSNYKGEIYMKVEFNHAKYGYTIPFTLPVNDEGKVINPTVGPFPVNYIVTKNKQSYADMNRLFNDMYITIQLKYDSDNNRYVWGIKNATNENNTMKLRLFEPKING